MDTLLGLQVTSFLSGALPGTILTASTALVFLYGGKMIIDGRMTIGTLVAYMAYHLRLLSPVQNMMNLSANLALQDPLTRIPSLPLRVDSQRLGGILNVFGRLGCFDSMSLLPVDRKREQDVAFRLAECAVARICEHHRPGAK